MNPQESFQYWLNQVTDHEVQEELQQLAKTGEAEIEERFYRTLAFGTGGLRGLIGAGSNRMNIYTVGQATKGLSAYLKKRSPNPAVAIAYDSRRKSSEFAHRAAQVLAANGITAYIFEELMPTPVLSYAVRALACDAGIVITASHNPAGYNGYKVYGGDGCQLTLVAAEAVQKEILLVDPFTDVEVMEFQEGLNLSRIRLIPDSLVDDYLSTISREAWQGGVLKDKSLKIVYSPLHGSGRRCVTGILKRNGYHNVILVDSQMQPDGEFPTCPIPNPELREALAEGLRVAQEVHGDLLLVTDPDCDRVGVAVRGRRGFRILSGNETGILLFHHILQRREMEGKMPSHPVCLKTIVTTDMVKPMAKDHGVEVAEVLTGFKFIGEAMGRMEEAGRLEDFLIGFEESYGYLTSSSVRDKDAVNAALLIAEMAAWNKEQGWTLEDVLESLYRKYGYFQNLLQTYDFNGRKGLLAMESFMEFLRSEPPERLGTLQVVKTRDFKKPGKVENAADGVAGSLPLADVLRFDLKNGHSLIIRPSGTEPKLKAYISALGESAEKSKKTINSIAEGFQTLIDEYLRR